MKKKWFWLVLLCLGVFSLGGVNFAWAAASENITITVTLRSLSVDVENDAVDNPWALGTVNGDTACDSWNAAPGPNYTAAPISWQDGVSVTNDGNDTETFGLTVGCTGGIAWANNSGTNLPGVDAFVYRAIFDIVGTHGFDQPDCVADTMAKADAISKFTDGDANGASVPTTGARLLFVEFHTPTGTTEAPATQKTLTLTISAETTF